MNLLIQSKTDFKRNTLLDKERKEWQSIIIEKIKWKGGIRKLQKKKINNILGIYFKSGYKSCFF